MILHAKKQDDETEQIISYMNSAARNEYIFPDAAEEGSKPLTEAYNQMLKKFINADNQVAMDLNNAMSVIGNSSNVKSLLEIAANQKRSIATIVEDSKKLTDSIAESENILGNIQQHVQEADAQSEECSRIMRDTVNSVNGSYEELVSSCEALEGFKKKAEQIDDIMKLVGSLSTKTQLLSLNAKIEATKAGEYGRGFSVVADEIGRLSSDTQKSMSRISEYVSAIKNDIDVLVTQMSQLRNTLDACKVNADESDKHIANMGDSMNSIMDQIDDAFAQTTTQNDSAKIFLDQLANVEKDSESLIEHCQDPARDMYTISRAIDKIRGNVARKQAKLSNSQWIDIYIVDHMIFTWRLYNMIAGFETLELKNLNRPQRCKFGLWYNAEDKDYLRSNPVFAEAGRVHDELHHLAVECYNANENGDKEAAMDYFRQAQEEYGVYSATMEKVKLLFND